MDFYRLFFLSFFLSRGGPVTTWRVKIKKIKSGFDHNRIDIWGLRVPFRGAVKARNCLTPRAKCSPISLTLAIRLSSLVTYFYLMHTILCSINKHLLRPVLVNSMICRALAPPLPLPYFTSIHLNNVPSILCIYKYFKTSTTSPSLPLLRFLHLQSRPTAQILDSLMEWNFIFFLLTSRSILDFWGLYDFRCWLISNNNNVWNPIFPNYYCHYHCGNGWALRHGLVNYATLSINMIETRCIYIRMSS